MVENMTKQKPFVYLKRNGRYRVDMSLSETGTLVRIDNFLDDIGEHMDKLKDGLNKLLLREREIKAELENKDGYSDVIEEIKKELQKIDKELGVDKQ